MKQNGMNLIARGIALAYDDLKRDIELLNESIDNCATSIRSSADLDGLPHSTSVGDPVGQRSVRIEYLEEERDAKQELVNAVDWAMQYISDRYSPEEAPFIKQAITTYLKRMQNDAMRIIDEKTSLSRPGFYSAKSVFLSQILQYLHLGKSKV